MHSHRKNTLVVDFGVLPKRPAIEQVEEFLQKFVKLDMADVRNIQLHTLKSCVFIEMNDAGVAPRLQKQHHLQHCFIREGLKYYIPIYVDGPTTTVRIHDLPPQMSNTVIWDHMEQYGKIISIHNEVWKNYFKGVPNGVRVVRMRMEKKVPSYIVINNERTFVSYPNTNPTHETQQQQQPANAPTDRTTIDEHQHVIADGPPAASESDEQNDNNDDDGSSANETDFEQESAGKTKRRLSTETSSSTKEDNQPKRTCNQGDQECERTVEEEFIESEWKVYNTRSKKK
uniref:Hypothetical conserved protein n=1 Tax=Aedes aegypti TaxID=7159 RepID=Q1HRK6_AEDAE|nr:hypothetical conserved protein [Aedes aegypti]